MKYYIESLEKNIGWQRRWKGKTFDSVAAAEERLLEYNFPDADHREFRIVKREVVVTHTVEAHLRYMGSTDEEIVANLMKEEQA